MLHFTHPDLAPLTRHLRAMYSSRLLVAAVHHLPVFETLAAGPLPMDLLREQLGLAERPAMVLFPALCAMGLLEWETHEKLRVSEIGRYLCTNQQPNLIGYVGLEKEDAGVLEMVERLRNDGPRESDNGISYVKEGEAPSPMDDPELSRYFTLALSGRAQLLAPIVAQHLPQQGGHLLDLAAGTGLYTYEWLLRNPEATATVFDRPQVLRVARELLDQFSRSGFPGADTVRQRVQFLPGDMLTDPLPSADLLLAASLFHDWPTETCYVLAERFAAALRPGGELWVHDAFLNDTLDGPLAVTDYSAALFWGTRGRAYSRQEYRAFLLRAGLVLTDVSLPTQLDYSLISAGKPSPRDEV